MDIVLSKNSVKWVVFNNSNVQRLFLYSDKKVLIIGGGPCGLRAAIEMQLIGKQII